MEEVKEKLSVKTKYQIVVVLLVAIIISLLIAVTVVAIDNNTKEEVESNYNTDYNYVIFNYNSNNYSVQILGYYVVDATYIKLVFNTATGKFTVSNGNLTYISKPTYATIDYYDYYDNLNPIKELVIAKTSCILYYVED